MPDRSRLLLAICLVVASVGAIAVLSGIREERQPASPAPGATAPVPEEPPPTRPFPEEPTRAETEALAARVAAREPALQEVALPALLWHHDRLAEALGVAEGRGTPGGRPLTIEEGVLLAETLGPMGAEALPALVALMTSRLRRMGQDGVDTAIARTAALAVARHLPTEVERAHDYFVHAKDPHVRQYLMVAAASMEPATDGVRALLAAGCRDPQPWVSGVALERLAALGAAAGPVLPTIRPLLTHELEGTRLQAAAAVLRIFGPDADAHTVFETQLSSIDPFDRAQAVQNLVALGSAGRGVWPALLPLLGDDRFALVTLPDVDPSPDTVSWGASEALVRLDARALEAGLLELVRGADALPRLAAGLALVGMGVEFEEAPAVLAEALALETRSAWLERTRVARIADDLEPALVDDGLLDAVTRHLHGLYGKEAGRALLKLGPRGLARVKSLLAEHDAAREFERHSILSALQDEPELGRELRAELAGVAKADSNAWNRETASELLEALSAD